MQGTPRSLATWVASISSADAKAWKGITYAAVAAACTLRIIRWIDNPALWLDEAFLSINLMDESLSGVLGPLQFLQSAPPGFLLVEKGVELLLGDGERALRLFPLLAALASVVLFAYVAWRLLAPPAATLAVGLFALGEPLLERAAEVKPYSVDVAVATGLLALAIWATDARPGRLGTRIAVVGVVGVACLWLSFPSVLTLTAALAALAAHAWMTGSRRGLVAVASVGAVALAIFGAVYAVASSNVGALSDAIFAGADDSPARTLDAARASWSLFVNPLGFENGIHGLAALLGLLGAIALLQRGSVHVLILLSVAPLLAVVADLVNRYPLGGRFSLFLVPSLLLLVGRGVQALADWSRRPVLVAGTVSAFLLASPLVLAVSHAATPPAREDVKPLLARLASEWREGDVLYVYSNSQYALRYYSTCTDCSVVDGGFPWPTRVSGQAPSGGPFPSALESVPPEVVVGSRESPGLSPADLEQLPSAGRVWLLFSHVQSHDGLSDESLALIELETRGELVEETAARGARLYLFELEP